MFRKMMSEQIAWYCNDADALSYSIKWLDKLLEEISDEQKRSSLLETRSSVVTKIGKLKSEKEG